MSVISTYSIETTEGRHIQYIVDTFFIFYCSVADSKLLFPDPDPTLRVITDPDSTWRLYSCIFSPRGQILTDNFGFGSSQVKTDPNPTSEGITDPDPDRQKVSVPGRSGSAKLFTCIRYRTVLYLKFVHCACRDRTWN